MTRLRLVLYCIFVCSMLIYEIDSKQKNGKGAKKAKRAVVKNSGTGTAGKYIIGCYYTSWSQYRNCRVGSCSPHPPDAKFYPENLPANLCTHVFYAFAVTRKDTGPTKVVPHEWNDDAMFKRMLNVRDSKSPPNFKLLLSFGGWTYSQESGGNEIMSQVAASPKMRKEFIASALDLVIGNKFDGFDMDWEYPGENDKESYTIFMREMAEAFHAKNLMVTAAVPLGKEKIKAGFEVKKLANILDLVNVMTYDCHGGSWEDRTGLNSPLHTMKKDKDRFSISDGMYNWYNAGMPKNKLVVGFATYGRSYTLSSDKHTGMFAPSIGGGRNGGGVQGIYSGEKGIEGYNEICQKIASGLVPKKQMYFDKKRVSPYYWYMDKSAGPQWMGYDDLNSFKIKVEWVKKEGFAGAFVWDLDFDDFTGKLCSLSQGQKYPLVGYLNNQLGGNFEYKLPKKSLFKYNTKQPRPGGKATGHQGSSSSWSGPSAEPSKFDPSFDPGKQGCGNKTGNVFNPKDCASYYVCMPGHPTALLMPCSSGTVFDGVTCNHDDPANPCVKFSKTRN